MIFVFQASRLQQVNFCPGLNWSYKDGLHVRIKVIIIISILRRKYRILFPMILLSTLAPFYDMCPEERANMNPWCTVVSRFDWLRAEQIRTESA